MTGGLTNRQAQLLTFIRDYIADHNGVSPSFSEMTDAIGLKAKSGVHRILDGLEGRGFIRRLHGKARAIEVVKDGLGDTALQSGLSLTEPVPVSALRASIPIAFFPPGEPCKSCAIRPGSDANQSPETIAMLKECIASGEPFFCHESTAIRDPKGLATDRHGNTYRRLPESHWRLCRGWTRALAQGIVARSDETALAGPAEGKSPTAIADAPETPLTDREKQIHDQAHAQGMKDAVDLMRESGT